MAHYSPELIERFIRDRDQRRAVISKFSGLNNPYAQTLCDLAARRLEWIEYNAEVSNNSESPQWIVDCVDVDQRIEAVNWGIGLARISEDMAGMDHFESSDILLQMLVALFPNYAKNWRKTKLNAYIRSGGIFEAVYDVWAREWGVADGGVSANLQQRVEVVPVEQRDRPYRFELENRPAKLSEIHRHVSINLGVSQKSVERDFYYFLKVAPDLVVCDFETGRLSRPSIFSQWFTYLLVGDEGMKLATDLRRGELAVERALKTIPEPDRQAIAILAANVTRLICEKNLRE